MMLSNLCLPVFDAWLANPDGLPLAPSETGIILLFSEVDMSIT